MPKLMNSKRKWSAINRAYESANMKMNSRIKNLDKIQLKEKSNNFLLLLSFIHVWILNIKTICQPRTDNDDNSVVLWFCVCVFFSSFFSSSLHQEINNNRMDGFRQIFILLSIWIKIHAYWLCMNSEHIEQCIYSLFDQCQMIWYAMHRLSWYVQCWTLIYLSFYLDANELNIKIWRLPTLGQHLKPNDDDW